MRIHLFTAGLLATLGAGFAAAGCADRPPQAPSSATRTTSGVVQDPSYGDSDLNGWSDPAASGNATHGSATVGATTPPPPVAPPTQRSPVIVVVFPDGGT